MNIPFADSPRGHGLVAVAVTVALLGGCAATPVQPSGAIEARARLTHLQADPNLAGRAPSALADAVTAVQLAEEPQTDTALGDYRVYIAQRRIDIASAEARTRFLEDQRALLVTQRQNTRLDARTREADAAHAEAAIAHEDAAVANASASIMAERAAELQRQIQALDVRVTDRGLVLTLGDVLFSTARADLQSGATGHLDKLVDFLNHYPDRTVRIEGYTDSVGSDAYNQGLSERRANSVQGYLRRQGIAAGRISAFGLGEDEPIAGNDTAAGRQQNRRVEVIVSNPGLAALE